MFIKSDRDDKVIMTVRDTERERERALNLTHKDE